MKVLHITNNYPTVKSPIFGIFVKEQIDSLCEIGIQNNVFFINGREGGKLAYLKAIIRLSVFLKKNKFDVIHCHHAFSAFVFLLTFRFLNVKRVLSYQNPPIKEGGNLFFLIFKIIFHAVIIKHQRGKKGKVYYLPNGTNCDFFRHHSRDECVEKLRLANEKNYIVFMDSYKRRAQKRVDRFDEVVDKLMAGGNPLMIHPLKLTNTRRDLIPYYLSLASVHVITSDFEGSPNSVKESLACDTYVVSTPVGNVKELLDGVGGCFVSANFDPENLAVLVKKSLLHKPALCREAFLKKGLTIQEVAVQLKMIYSEILKNDD